MWCPDRSCFRWGDVRRVRPKRRLWLGETEARFGVVDCDGKFGSFERYVVFSILYSVCVCIIYIYIYVDMYILYIYILLYICGIPIIHIGKPRICFRYSLILLPKKLPCLSLIQKSTLRGTCRSVFSLMLWERRISIISNLLLLTRSLIPPGK